jgi:hypothetical protein
MSTSLRVFIKSERFNLDSGEDEIFFFCIQALYLHAKMDGQCRARQTRRSIPGRARETPTDLLRRGSQRARCSLYARAGRGAAGAGWQVA